MFSLPFNFIQNFSENYTTDSLIVLSLMSQAGPEFAL
jgi:hypothetical protein